MVLEGGVEGAVCVLDHIQRAEEERLILQTNIHIYYNTMLFNYIHCALAGRWMDIHKWVPYKKCYYQLPSSKFAVF